MAVHLVWHIFIKFSDEIYLAFLDFLRTLITSSQIWKNRVPDIKSPSFQEIPIQRFKSVDIFLLCIF